MNREFLKSLGIEDENINKIMAEYGKDVNEYKAKADTLDDVKSQLDTANSTIKELKKNNADNEELQKTIKEHEATIKKQKEEYEKALKDTKIDAAIKEALSNSNAKHSDLLVSQIDKTKLVINDDNNVIGLTEQIEALKTTYKDLFSPTLAGNTPTNNERKTGEITKEMFNKMGYKERAKLNQENPELYQELAKS